MSDTPRTDAFMESLVVDGSIPLERAAETVTFAQALERENAALREAGFTLTARLCAIAEVGEIDGYEVIRRDSVMDFVTRWRMQVDAASKQGHSQGRGESPAAEWSRQLQEAANPQSMEGNGK
jgi:hypothetical protein